MHMPRPFEGVFGNTCELRMLEFLLPLEGMEFNVTELSDEVGVSRVTVGRVVKKFVAWGILNASNRKIPRYSINPSSPIVRALESMNNALISQIIAEEKEEEEQAIDMLMKKRKATPDLLAK
ncbi:winged helix-turn-helix domain-containing protein [Methanocalculus taiwanensis]|uniref:winged helix-turn-helix domain-containing protein n=1 Tax=Methanocalculus taiwanensis TaxID=106207 RepID=UPI0021018FAC|nr:winged helix-turn-helix domain-containing protein [Methanocalculus taiwanensis]